MEITEPVVDGGALRTSTLTSARPCSPAASPYPRLGSVLLGAMAGSGRVPAGSVAQACTGGTSVHVGSRNQVAAAQGTLKPLMAGSHAGTTFDITRSGPPRCRPSV